MTYFRAGHWRASYWQAAYWGAPAGGAIVPAAPSIGGGEPQGREGRRQKPFRQWIKYPDGTMREFRSRAAYDLEIARLLAARAPEAIEPQLEAAEEIAPVVKPDVRAMLDRMAERSLELSVDTLVAEVQALTAGVVVYRHRKLIEQEDEEILLVLSQIV